MPLKLQEVHDFEGRRLRGEEVFPRDSTPPNIVEILDFMPGELGAWLVIEILRAREVSAREIRAVEYLLSQVGERAAKSLSQALAHNQIHMQGPTLWGRVKKRKFREQEWLPIRKIISSESDIFFRGYQDVIPKIEIIHADLDIEQLAISHTFPEAIVSECENMRTFIGSDIFVDSFENIYLDNNSWFGARSHNLINDTMLMARSYSKVIVRDRMLNKVKVKSGFWLGYPLMNAWGHWMHEGMLRIEIFSRHPEFEKIPLIVSSDVPVNFLETAKLIFPNITFLKFRNSTQLEVDRLLIAPSRTYHPHNVHWSLADEQLRLNGDPEISISFSERVRDRVTALSSQKEVTLFPSHVHIDRTHAAYRPSRNAATLRELAHRNKYFSVDPGSLSTIDQLSLFVGAERIFGQTGSGLYLTQASQMYSRSLFVGSDFSHDWAGLAYSCQASTKGSVKFVLGQRDYVGVGFSERLYHQDFSLSDTAFQKIEEFLSSE